MDPLIWSLGLIWYAVAGLVLCLWRMTWKGAALVCGALAFWKAEAEYAAGHEAEVAMRERDEAESLAG
jgi:hypothetical protein